VNLDIGDGGFQLFLSSLEGSFLSSSLGLGLTSNLGLAFRLGEGLGDLIQKALSLGDFGAVVSLGVDEGLPVHVVAEQQVVGDGEELGSLVLSDGTRLAEGVSQSDDGEGLSDALQETMSIQLVQSGAGCSVLKVEVRELKNVSPETFRLILLLIPKGIQEPDGLLLVVASAKRQELLVIGLSVQRCHIFFFFFLLYFTLLRCQQTPDEVSFVSLLLSRKTKTKTKRKNRRRKKKKKRRREKRVYLVASRGITEDSCEIFHELLNRAFLQ